MIVSGQPLEIPKKSIWEMLQATAERVPNQPATWFLGQQLTYQQLQQSTFALMGKLQASGVKLGDRVGIMLPNCPQYLMAYYAVSGIGAIVVQVNPMSTVPELEYFIEDTGLEHLFIYDKFLPIARVVRKGGNMHCVVVAFGDSDVSLQDNEVWLNGWLQEGAPPAIIPAFNPDTTVAVLQFTGGTTGRPKGAMLSHSNVVANAYQIEQIILGSVQADDKVLCALPFFHVYAMSVCQNLSVLTGIQMIIVPRFQVDELLQVIELTKPTIFPAVPTMYVALSHAVPEGSKALASLRVCNSGGAPMPVNVMTEFERITGATVLEGYGLSETAPVTHFNTSAEARKIGSIGTPARNTDAKIVDVLNISSALPSGEIGELAIRGPQVMLGYWNRPEESAEVLQDGWLLTGDIAKMDEDGYAYIVDRKKDLIIASGFNVYPRDVEEALYRHPAVLEAAVIGVPDDYRGETVKAYVVLKPQHELSEEDLSAFCRTQLAAYKVPTLFEFRSELPKTAVGKILRRALRS